MPTQSWTDPLVSRSNEATGGHYRVVSHRESAHGRPMEPVSGLTIQESHGGPGWCGSSHPASGCRGHPDYLHKAPSLVTAGSGFLLLVSSLFFSMAQCRDDLTSVLTVHPGSSTEPQVWHDWTLAPTPVPPYLRRYDWIPRAGSFSHLPG